MTADGDIAAQKTAVRAAMAARLRALSADERARRSAIICARIVDSAAWVSAERVLLFSPIRSEPDIAPLGAIAFAVAIVTFHAMLEAVRTFGSLAATLGLARPTGLARVSHPVFLGPVA